jgi:uncharacterized protein (TIGR02246 family)
MGAQENADLVQRGYTAFSAGDIDTLSGLFADDAVWHVPGNSSMSGTKEGRGAILAFFGEIMTRTNGTATVTVQHVIGGDEHTIGLHRTHGERDGKTLDQDAVLVFTVRDGQVAEVKEFHENTTTTDDFWG